MPKPEDYYRRVTVKNPGLLVLVVDDSPSMSEPMREDPAGRPRFELVEDNIRAMLEVFIQRCMVQYSTRNDIEPRYFVDLIRYGPEARPLNAEPEPVGNFVKHLSGAPAVGETGLFGRPTGKRGPVSFYETDTRKAFELAAARIEHALSGKFGNSYPPMLFHLTDGISHTDAEPVAAKIRKLRSLDGEVLVVNALIDTANDLEHVDARDFPGFTSQAEVGKNIEAQRLFRMSSEVPRPVLEHLRMTVFPQLRPGSRLFFDVRTATMIGDVIQVTGTVGDTQRWRPPPQLVKA